MNTEESKNISSFQPMFPTRMEEEYAKGIQLLKDLIATPSLSREEDKSAELIRQFLEVEGVATHRSGNNIWALNKHFDVFLPTILLNSHHDTVRPNPAYTRNPFLPQVEEGKLFGLGSNDAGGSVAALLGTFLYFYDQHSLKYNLVIALTAEEEISGHQGIESIYTLLPEIDFAIVGEPTLTHLATAEKGLLVVDCTTIGKAGHAAREEGENAIYKALKDIEWFRTFQFPKISETLGSVKMSVTVISAGKQHNVVPSECNFVVDVRVTDEYSHEEILEMISQNVSCQVKPRSMRMRSSKIGKDHPIVQSGIRLGKQVYGSPTTSDQALIPVPSLKCGPGDSARSHTADEFIYLEEIKEGLRTYIGMLELILK
ncbi:MAG: M20 family metallo-hydrolase [Chitinophagaceae bacterium]